MPSNSILTNSEAARALLQLNATNRQMAATQGRISSGLKVNSAKDNASTFAIATGMRSDVATFRTIKENLSLGQAVVGASLSAAEKIQAEIQNIKTKIAQAKDQPAGRGLLQLDIQASIDQINNFVNSSTFNGVNLLDGVGKATGQQFSITSALDRDADGVPTLTSLRFNYHDLTIADPNAGLGTLANMSVDRGDVLENDTSAKTSATVTVTGAATGAGTFTFTYTDAGGVDRVLTTSVANTTGAGAAATAFVTAHGDTLASLGFSVSDNGLGALTFTRTDGSRNLFKSFASSAAGLTTPVAESLTMNFSGKALNLDDEVRVNALLNGSDKIVIMRVSNSTTGAGLGTDDDGNTIVSLNVDDVAGNGVTAQGIATAVRAALLSATVTGFATSASTGAAIGVSAAGTDGTLTLTTASATTGVDSLTSVDIATDFDTLVRRVEAAEDALQGVLGQLGAAANRLESQGSFIDEMIKSIDENIGILVDADMAEEAAKLTALQTRQQLGLQALSIANAQPQAILALFQG